VFMLDLRSAQLRYPREFATASLHFDPGFGYSGEEKRELLLLCLDGYQLARNFVLLLMRLLAYACKPAVVNHISICLRHSRQLGEISQSAMLTLMAVARIYGVYA